MDGFNDSWPGSKFAYCLEPRIAGGQSILTERGANWSLFISATLQYNPVDEFRITYNHPAVAYDWEMQQK